MHGCLGAWKGGPVRPGPPPLGSWGASQGLPGGGPGPKLQGPIRATSTCRPFGFASKGMSIWVSIFGRLGVDLGSLLGSFMLGSFWRLFRPKLVPEPSSNRLIFEKVIFHEPFTIKVRRFFTQDGAPKRPKIAPRRVQDHLGSVFWTLEFSLRFCIVFGSVLVPF